MKFAAAFTFLPLATSLRLPIQRRAVGSRASPLAPQNASTGETLRYISNYQNTFYFTNISIGGVEMPVTLNTGSADLWVSPVLPLTGVEPDDVSTNVNETYGLGSIAGPLIFAPFSLGPYDVPSQAFINATQIQNMDITIQSGARGLMGVSFETTYSSPINAALQNATLTSPTAPNSRGRSPVANIFLQNPSMRSMLDILLGRDQDVEANSGGIFSLGEHVPGYEDVDAMPRLPRTLARGEESTPRWNIPFSGISVDGESIPLNFSQPGSPRGQGIALMDTGATTAFVPFAVVDRLYSQIEGAYFSNASQSWIVPCAAPVANVSVFFGGNEYPVNPLDLTATFDARPYGLNKSFCAASFTDITSLQTAGLSGFDVWLGSPFLRNVYASFNYGDDGVDGGNPFMQLLPLTNQHQAYADFQLSRRRVLDGLPPTATRDEVEQLYRQQTANTTSPSSGSDGGAETQDLSTVGSLSSDVEKEEVQQSLLDRVNTYGPVIMGLLSGVLLIGLVLCAVGLATYVRGGARKGAGVRNVSPSYAPVRVREVGSGAMGHGGGEHPEDVPFVVPVMKYRDE
ncbi:aspartic peptidase domain-containing protein [Amylostereum chailletii]|nr:aspartic peptidase domain-containing protein [Amylostereum chailletii]